VEDSPPPSLRERPAPRLPSHCRPLGEARTWQTDIAVARRWELRCREHGLIGSELAVEGLAGSGTDVLIQVSLLDGRRIRAVVSARTPRFTVPPREQSLRVVTDYTRLGIEHLASGLEHLLFGDRPASARLRRASRPARGHGLHRRAQPDPRLGGSEDRQPAPPPWSKSGIAASLVALGVELATKGADRRSHPWLLALLFGLLHGFGFAGALRAAGLPAEAIPLTLFSFNLGVEIGQLAFVAIALNTVALARPFLEGIPAAVGRVPAYAIGSLGVFWCLDRGAQLF